MRILCPILALLASAASAHRAPVVWLGVPSGAESCRTPLLAAIRERRPDVDVRVGRAHGGGDVSARLREEEGVWRLVVRVEGLTPLRRVLPSPGESCAATADVAALMLDRYLDDVHWTGTPVRIERPVAPPPPVPAPAPPPPPTPTAPEPGPPTPATRTAATVSPPAPPPTTPEAAPARPTPPAASRPALHAQAAIELGPSVAATSLGAWPFLDADFAVRLGAWQVGLGGSVTGPRETPISASTPAAGAYDVETGSARLVGTYRLPLGPGALRFELAPGVEFLGVTASGSGLFHVHAGLAASPYIGVRLAYELPLPLKFALALRAEGRADLWPAEFDVEGLSGGVSTLRWGGGVALALSRVFF